jgi:hypothetical protein
MFYNDGRTDAAPGIPAELLLFSNHVAISPKCHVIERWPGVLRHACVGARVDE